jgi:hypothetical protein
MDLADATLVVLAEERRLDEPLPLFVPPCGFDCEPFDSPHSVDLAEHEVVGAGACGVAAELDVVVAVDVWVAVS